MARPLHTYRIHLDPEPEGGYTVTVPALPGCVTWGRDFDEAADQARECIEGFLEALVKAGEPVPLDEPAQLPGDPFIQVALPIGKT